MRRILPFALLSLFVTSPALLRAQRELNLVPDPGFENYGKPPGDHSQMFLREWFNPDGATGTFPHATPDHIHTAGGRDARVEAYHFGRAVPYEGKGMMGLTEFNPAKVDWREYVVIKLIEPLEVGAEYRVRVRATRGKGPYFYGGSMTDGLGVAVASEKPKQVNGEMLTDYGRVLQIEEPHEWKEWTLLESTFDAYVADQYVIVGNFIPDSRQDRRPIPGAASSFNKEYSYVFIDKVEITKLIDGEPERVVSTEPPVSGGGPADGLSSARGIAPPRTFMGREVKISSVVEVEDPEFVLEVWDSMLDDGDIISLQFNGEWVLRNHKVSKTPVKVPIYIDPTKNNTLVLHAHNLGSMPPNTAEAGYTDRYGHRHIFVMKSDMSTSGAIQFKATGAKRHGAGE